VAATLGALGPGGAHAVKAARDASGAHRPDKLIAYFADVDTALRAGEVLRASLAGLATLGVPFTATLSDDGLVSWGADPPLVRGRGRAAGGQSWRQWVVDQIAYLLVVGGATGPGPVEPWRFALSYLASRGLDIATWAPTPALWAR
jgi:hypothetical protein